MAIFGEKPRTIHENSPKYRFGGQKIIFLQFVCLVPKSTGDEVFDVFGTFGAMLGHSGAVVTRKIIFGRPAGRSYRVGGGWARLWTASSVKTLTAGGRVWECCGAQPALLERRAGSFSANN